MVNCPNCNDELEHHQEVCSKCGVKLDWLTKHLPPGIGMIGPERVVYKDPEVYDKKHGIKNKFEEY